MKLIDIEPVLKEIEEQQEYFEQAEDFDCAEAVMCAKWAVVNAKEVKAISIEWLNDWRRWSDSDGDTELSLAIDFLIDRWQKEQECK